MFHPVHVVGAPAQGGLWPRAVWTTWVPADSAMPLASAPQGTSCISPLSSACCVGPTTATSMGWPSIVSRLETQFPGTSTGVGADLTLGMPISAMPSGRASGPAE